MRVCGDQEDRFLIDAERQALNVRWVTLHSEQRKTLTSMTPVYKVRHVTRQGVFLSQVGEVSHFQQRLTSTSIELDIPLVDSKALRSIPRMCV